MIDGADGETRVSRAVLRRARKAYPCGECGRQIAAGERYEDASGLWYDGAATWFRARTCAHCLAARAWLLAECSGWVFSLVLEDLEEHWREEPTCRSLRLGRLIVGMRRRWARFDGAGLIELRP